jgi:hypothetical protein
MAAYTIRRVNSTTWNLHDRKSGEQVGALWLSNSGYIAESERLKMKAEASDPWLILRMVFNTEEFHLEQDASTHHRLTPENVRELLR